MSTATPSIGALLGRRGSADQSSTHPVLAWLIRYSPSQGWATLAILLITLVVVADSVNVAGWVDSGGLTAALVWSAARRARSGEGSRAVVRADAGGAGNRRGRGGLAGGANGGRPYPARPVLRRLRASDGVVGSGDYGRDEHRPAALLHRAGRHVLDSRLSEFVVHIQKQQRLGGGGSAGNGGAYQS